MKYNYTEEDIEFLRQHYPCGGWDLIMQRFPTLTKECIYKKCRRMGIKSKNLHRKNFDISKKRVRWTSNEIDILKSNYSKMPVEKLLKMLPNRNANMIMNEAKRFKLVSYSRNQQIWKENEIQYLKDNWETVPDKIMAEHLNRTFRSVKFKREELGLYRINKDETSYPTLSKYLRGQNQKWKKDSMLFCDYKCVLTGSKNFEIHHLYGVSNIINDILNQYPFYKDKSFDDYSEEDLSFLLERFLEKQDEYPLGVCVDKKLHVLFHSMYGQYYNTPEQWEQFCKDYKRGIYKNYI